MIKFFPESALVQLEFEKVKTYLAGFISEILYNNFQVASFYLGLACIRKACNYDNSSNNIFK